MADIRTSPLRPVVRLRPTRPRHRSRSPSLSPERRSPFRYHELDPLLSNLSPESTLRALTAADAVPRTEKVAQDILTKSIAQVSTAERALGIRAAVAAQKLKEWYQEVQGWQWPKGLGARLGKGFIPPAASDAEYLGSLPADVVKRYQARIEEIRDGMDGLDVEELKEHVLNVHVPGRSRPSSSASSVSVGPPSFSYVQLSDFNAIITATILRLLPVLSRLNILLDAWDVRLLVLHQIPGLLAGLKTARAALDSSMAVLEAEEPTGKDAAPFTMDTFRAKRAELEKMVVSAGKKMDRILDLLEGREDSLPESWIDDLEAIETDFGTWVVAAERRALENEWKRLDKRPKSQKSPETPKHQLGAETKESVVDTPKACQENGKLPTELVDEESRSAPQPGPSDPSREAGENAGQAAVDNSAVPRSNPEHTLSGPEPCATVVASIPALDGVSEGVDAGINSSDHGTSSTRPEAQTASPPEVRPSTESDTTQRDEQSLPHTTQKHAMSATNGGESTSVDTQRDVDVSLPIVVVPADQASSDPAVDNGSESSVSVTESGKLEDKSSVDSGEESRDEVREIDTPSSTTTHAGESQVDISSTPKEPPVSPEVTRSEPLPSKDVSTTEDAGSAFPECSERPGLSTGDSQKGKDVPADESTEHERDAAVVTPSELLSPPPTHDNDNSAHPDKSIDSTSKLSTLDTPPDTSQPPKSTPGPLNDVDQGHVEAVSVRPDYGQIIAMGEGCSPEQGPESPIEAPKSRPKPLSDLKPDSRESHPQSSNISTAGSLVTDYSSPLSTPGIRDDYGATPQESPLVVDPTTPLQTDYPPSGRARTNSDHTLRQDRLLRLESQNGSAAAVFKHSRAASLPLQRFINEGLDPGDVHFLPEDIPTLRRDSIESIEVVLNSDSRSSPLRSNASSYSPPSVRRQSVHQRSGLHFVKTATQDGSDKDEPSSQPAPLKGSKSQPSINVTASPSASDVPPIATRSSKRLPASPSINSLESKQQDGETAAQDSMAERNESKPSSLKPENVRPTSSSKSADEQLDEKISSILTTIPARIRLGPAPVSDSDQRSVTSSISPHKNERSPHVTPSRASTPTPSLTLTPAFPRTRHSHLNTPEESSGRLYHLHRNGKSAPVKLFIRSVGADGERVMVRVGGGWADLGEYLREYVLHHGRRGLPEGPVEVQELPPHGSSALSSPGTLMPTPTPFSRPASVVGRRPSSSLGLQKIRRTAQTPDPADLSAESPSSRSPRSPRSAASLGRRLSVSSNNSFGDSPYSSTYSTPLGLAGPKPRSRRVSMSPESEAWVEDVLGLARRQQQAKMSGAGREHGGGRAIGEPKPRSVSDIGTVGLNKRVLLRGLNKR